MAWTYGHLTGRTLATGAPFLRHPHQGLLGRVLGRLGRRRQHSARAVSGRRGVSVTVVVETYQPEGNVRAVPPFAANLRDVPYRVTAGASADRCRQFVGGGGVQPRPGQESGRARPSGAAVPIQVKYAFLLSLKWASTAETPWRTPSPAHPGNPSFACLRPR